MTLVGDREHTVGARADDQYVVPSADVQVLTRPPTQSVQDLLIGEPALGVHRGKAIDPNHPRAGAGARQAAVYPAPPAP
jgi:hypothetical protein